ncbi:TetR/AcrR family transcriptional regulator [Polymorphospora rubra]|uniref:HTH tetR-type domain-containing protein n=1 Tax=Polymorphospora rubra TaxID=338584 RepID=A0A810N3W6_9ACTN|nr:TetR/AcrR family transcriptional regulator [Polymorphospora rubra]BCJ67620.1 hypothetical protein Prubr_46410 [Polymorphospora rubra]
MSRTRPLTPELIAAAALEVGDREGAKAMSMRRIAAELGCDPMALYRHFADRDALLDAVADLALNDVPDPDPAAGWEDRLRHLAGGIRSAALAHPGIAAHIAGRPPLHGNGRRLALAMITALVDAGLSPTQAIRTAQALVAYLSAALAMAVRVGGDGRDERWHHVNRALSESAGQPVGDALPPTGSEEQFSYGLRLLLAGIRAEAHDGRPRQHGVTTAGGG